MQFVAMSKRRVYVVDDLERLVVLNLETGARLDALSILGHGLRLINSETDRIYLASETGLVQCLHEVELTAPIQHQGPPAPADTEAAAGEGEPATGESAPAMSEDPFAGQEADPFEGGAEKVDGEPPGGGQQDAPPDEDAEDDQDPFGASPFGGNPFE
jgi:hypothetical protein